MEEKEYTSQYAPQLRERKMPKLSPHPTNPNILLGEDGSAYHVEQSIANGTHYLKQLTV